eukprot:EG_transcript_2097
MPPFSSILRHAVASKQLGAPSAGPEGTVGPVRLGRIKSFSQKSGWGFIQLFEQSGEALETARDVFFHRADVTRVGPVDLRPGILVHCRVVSTGKGEKASGIAIIEAEEEDRLSGHTVRANSVVGDPASPMAAAVEDDRAVPLISSQLMEPSLAMEGAGPQSMLTAAYSLRGTGSRIFWACTTCGMKNCIPGRLRVMVVCATCHHAHAVQQWVCRCGQFNKRDSRQCTNCDELYATSCQQLSVLLADDMAEEEVVVPGSAAPMRRGQPRRSRWSHTADGWMHSVIGAPIESTWCQDATTGPQEPVKYDNSASPPPAQSLASCQERLLWARNWLFEGRASPPEEAAITKDWLYRFSEELCLPQFRLFRPVQGRPSFAPNPCADVANVAVSQVYEATGVVLALAYAWRMPLFSVMPLWMARVLLGLPTSLEDLKEFDPALFQKVDLLMKHSNVDMLKVPYLEEVSCFGLSKTFTSPHGPWVTQMNKHLYGVWLKDVYLSASIEVQMKHIQRGFLTTLLNSQLHHGLTPDALTSVINGDGNFDVRRACKSLKVCPALHGHPVLENWVLHILMALSSRQWYQLLRFVTGVGKLPQEGMEMVASAITICHDPRLPQNNLPMVNRSLGQLILPAFSSPELLRQTLLHALNHPLQA